MKTLALSAAVALVLAAGTLSAEEAQTVLTPGNVLYATQPGEHVRLDVLRRNGEANQVLIVPETEDEAIESQSRLVWDSVTSTLFAVWVRELDERTEIRLASYSADGVWSMPVIITPATLLQRADLHVVLTHAPTDVEGDRATLVHVAWWSIGPTGPSADYALVAFEKGAHVSTEVATVESLNDAPESEALEGDASSSLPALHPPLAMVRRETGVEIAYGAPRTSAVKRLVLTPRADARMWRPGRTGGGSTPRAPLTTAADSKPVHAFISVGGRIVLYAPDTQFRYSVFDRQWSPVQMILLDEKVTSDQLVAHLRATVDAMAPIAEAPPN